MMGVQNAMYAERNVRKALKYTKILMLGSASDALNVQTANT